MPLMIKLNRNIMKVYLCLDNGHFITVNRLPIIDPKFSAINSAIGVDKKQTTDNNMTLFNRLFIIPPI